MIIPASLEEAVKDWELFRDAEHPIFHDITVTTQPDSKKKGKGPRQQELWTFYTDNRQTHAFIFRPNDIETIFRKLVLPFFKEAYGSHAVPSLNDAVQREAFLEMIAFHNFFSLLNHELLHPANCPDSKDDEKAVDLALFKGISEAVPTLSRLEALKKVGYVRNLMWDFTIDSFQYSFITTNTPYRKNLETILAAKQLSINGTQITAFPEGVIPIFDAVSIEGSSRGAMPKNAYMVTRLLYGLLFCGETETRKKLYGHFMDAVKRSGFSEREALEAARRTVSGIVSELSRAQLASMGIKAADYTAAVNDMFNDIDKPSYSAHQRLVVDTIAKVFMAKATRYDAVKGFIKPLAPYISTTEEESRHKHGDESEGAGGAGSALENLLDQLSQQEANQLLQELANQALQSMGNTGSPGSGPEVKLAMQSADEYYRRNAKEIPVRSPHSEAIILQLGKDKVWEKVSSETLMLRDLAERNLEGLLAFQQATGLPVLVKLSPTDYVINYFQEKEIPLTSFTYQASGIDLPETIVLLEDSSGSMGQAAYVGSGSKFDALNHVIYGIMKTIGKASRAYAKPVELFVIRYGPYTSSAGPVSALDFLSPSENPVKTLLLTPPGGGTTLSPSVLRDARALVGNSKAVWCVFSDGDLQNSDLSSVFKQFEGIAGQNSSSLLHFQLYDTGGSFGSFMNNLSVGKTNVFFHQISNMGQITGAALDVIIQYKRFTPINDLSGILVV